jgi:hypothetical protein
VSPRVQRKRRETERDGGGGGDSMVDRICLWGFCVFPKEKLDQFEQKQKSITITNKTSKPWVGRNLRMCLQTSHHIVGEFNEKIVVQLFLGQVFELQ